VLKTMLLKTIQAVCFGILAALAGCTTMGPHVTPQAESAMDEMRSARTQREMALGKLQLIIELVKGGYGSDEATGYADLLERSIRGVAFDDDAASSRPKTKERRVSKSATSPQTPRPEPSDREGDLIFACGSKGLAADFVTGNCVSSSGRQVNPFNLYPPFQTPLPQPSPSELIMRCAGRAVDFVTGQCM
jgi:hypothetical protein